MKKLALVMITLNEEAKLRRCLSSAASYVDEIVIADTGSTDSTKEIAAEFGAKVFDFHWVHDFSAARNFALECTDAEWRLVLDADEWIESISMDDVNRFMDAGNSLGRIERISDTESLGEVNETRDFITRLIPRGCNFEGAIHEQVNSELARKNVPIVVQHDGYRDMKKSDRNIPLLLRELEKHPGDGYYSYMLAKEYGGLERLEDSEKYYALAYRSLSGRERFAPNVVTDYIYLLMKLQCYPDILTIVQQDYPWKKAYPDYHFACGVFYLDLVLSDPAKYMSYLPLIEQSYRNCLEIGETERYDSVVGTGSYAAYYNLGNYYEVLGDKAKASLCYRSAAELGYSRAEQRLLIMNEE